MDKLSICNVLQVVMNGNGVEFITTIDVEDVLLEGDKVEILHTEGSMMFNLADLSWNEDEEVFELGSDILLEPIS